MNRSDMAGRVRGIIGDQLGIRNEDVRMNARLVDDLGIDSIGLLELALEFEESFSLGFSQEEMATLLTAQDVVDYVHQRSSGE